MNMKKIITQSFYESSSTRFYAVVDCNIDGENYPKHCRIGGNNTNALRANSDTKRELLRNGIISILPIMAKRIEVIKPFPGFHANSDANPNVVFYLPYTETRDKDSGKSKIIFDVTYIEYNGVRLSIDILDTYPDYFKISLVENPEIKEIEYI